jgi:serine/threonine protein phosphatase 1
MMRPRTIAIGDTHGCSRALEALLTAIGPRREDVIVTLGDYINRGPDSRGVLDRLITLEGKCKLIPILGNHDEVLLAAIDGEPNAFIEALDMGAAATLASYNPGRVLKTEADLGQFPPDLSALFRHCLRDAYLARVPPEHVAFLRCCRDYYETETHIFVHAQYEAGMPMEDQPSYLLRWESLRNITPGPHESGKRAIVGHTPQKSGEILDLGHLVCIDTYCHGGGWLTALDVHTEEVWQANREGEQRRPRSG